MPSPRSHLDVQRVAYRELKLLVTRQPYESKPWRDFWVVSIPSMTLFFIAYVILTPPLLSLTTLVLIAAMTVLPRLVYRAFARAGWVTTRPPRGTEPPRTL